MASLNAPWRKADDGVAFASLVKLVSKHGQHSLLSQEVVSDTRVVVRVPLITTFYNVTKLAL